MEAAIVPVLLPYKLKMPASLPALGEQFKMEISASIITQTAKMVNFITPLQVLAISVAFLVHSVKDWPVLALLANQTIS